MITSLPPSRTRRPTFRAALRVALLLALPASAGAQFNVRLQLDTRSAEQALAVYRGGGNPSAAAATRGSRLVTATTALLSGRQLRDADLEAALSTAREGRRVQDDPFLVNEARAAAPEIGAMLDDLRSRDFAGSVVSTVSQLFPQGTGIDVAFPVYVTAFGHRNADGFVRRVEWQGDVPQFVPEGKGMPTIVVDLSKTARNGRTPDERFTMVAGTVAHEVFHAAFAAYKDRSSFWRRWNEGPRRPVEDLFDLAQNEGIAYYLNFVLQSRARFTGPQAQEARAAFEEFNRMAGELLNPRLSPDRRRDIMLRANASDYWSNFGAITGMVMARAVDGSRGRDALRQTIASGPLEFFRAYAELESSHPDIPRLSAAVREALRR
jgi:hypothetical protein